MVAGAIACSFCYDEARGRAVTNARRERVRARPTLKQACQRYIHRYTMEHIPAWARHPFAGKYYAPQFRSDREWYDSTLFPGEIGNPHACAEDCFTTGQTWPLGQWLNQPLTERAS
jgi:hypothetical protein